MKIFRPACAILALCGSLLLSACGGGSGGGSGESNPPVTPPPASSNNWDTMKWDQNNWQ